MPCAPRRRAPRRGCRPPPACPGRPTTRSEAPAGPWRSYRTAGTCAPGTTVSQAAGRASPRRTRPARPTVVRPTRGGCPPGRPSCPARPGQPVRQGREKRRPRTERYPMARYPWGCHPLAMQRSPRDKRWSGRRRPAWPERLAAGRSSARASLPPGAGSRPCSRRPGPRQAPWAGTSATSRWCRRAVRVCRRRPWRPRPPDRRWPGHPLSRAPTRRSAKHRRLPYRRIRHRPATRSWRGRTWPCRT